MINKQAYRNSLRYEEAIWELEKYRETQFDPKTLDIFLDLYRTRQLVKPEKDSEASG
jgi:response regulator RpfG family c-di-GMP phosphodiesterase